MMQYLMYGWFYEQFKLKFKFVLDNNLGNSLPKNILKTVQFMPTFVL